MTRHWIAKRTFSLALSLCSTGVWTNLPAATLTEHMDIDSRQATSHTLNCDYRILTGAELITALA